MTVFSRFKHRPPLPPSSTNSPAPTSRHQTKTTIANLTSSNPASYCATRKMDFNNKIRANTKLLPPTNPPPRPRRPTLKLQTYNLPPPTPISLSNPYSCPVTPQIVYKMANHTLWEEPQPKRANARTGERSMVRLQMKTAVMILYWLAPSELAIRMSEPKYEVTDGHLRDFSEYYLEPRGQELEEAFDNVLRAIGKHQPFVEMVVNMAREKEVSDDEIEELLVSILSAMVRRNGHIWRGSKRLPAKWFGSGTGTKELIELASPSSTAAMPMSAATSFSSTATKLSSSAISFSSSTSNSSPATTTASSATTSHSDLYHELNNEAHLDRSFTKSPDGLSRWKTSTPSTTHSLPLIRELSPLSHAYHCLDGGSRLRATSVKNRRSLDGQQRHGHSSHLNGDSRHPNSFPTYIDKGFKSWLASDGPFPSKETTPWHNMSSGADHQLDDKDNLKHSSASVLNIDREAPASLAYASYQSFATDAFEESKPSPSISSHEIQDIGAEESIDYLSLLENEFPGALDRISEYQEGSTTVDEIPENEELVRPLQLQVPANDIQALAYEDVEEGFPTPSTDANEIMRQFFNFESQQDQ